MAAQVSGQVWCAPSRDLSPCCPQTQKQRLLLWAVCQDSFVNFSVKLGSKGSFVVPSHPLRTAAPRFHQKSEFFGSSCDPTCDSLTAQHSGCTSSVFVFQISLWMHAQCRWLDQGLCERKQRTSYSGGWEFGVSAVKPSRPSEKTLTAPTGGCGLFEAEK